MGETQIVDIAKRLDEAADLTGIRGTAVIRKGLTSLHDSIEVPSYEAVKDDKDLFNRAFTTIYRNHDPFRGTVVAQKHGDRFVIQFPPSYPLSPPELDRIYALPFLKRPHPSCEQERSIPGFETVKFSLISHRGCCGECSFCSLSMHQGRIVQSRTTEIHSHRGQEINGTT